MCKQTFNVGDTVYFMFKNTIQRKEISAMMIRGDGYTNTVYFDDNSPSDKTDKQIPEWKCYATQKEVIASIVKKE